MPLNSYQAVERYRTLGMAIEAAVAADCWDEVDALINERDGLIEHFQKSPSTLTPQAQSQLKACDQRLLEFLTGAKNQVSTQMRGAAENKQLRHAYKAKPQSTAFDRAS